MGRRNESLHWPRQELAQSGQMFVQVIRFTVGLEGKGEGPPKLTLMLSARS